MHRSIQFQKENVLNIGIHLTPKTGLSNEIRDFHCNHSTQFTYEINELRPVTQLHIGETNEN